MIKQDKNPVSSALFGVAGIQTVVGLLVWSVQAPKFGAINWVISFSFLIFFALAIIARKARIPAAVIAAALYGTFLVLQASISPQLLMKGQIFKIPIVVLLIIALVFAFRTTGKKAADGEARQGSHPPAASASTPSVGGKLPNTGDPEEIQT